MKFYLFDPASQTAQTVFRHISEVRPDDVPNAIYCAEPGTGYFYILYADCVYHTGIRSSASHPTDCLTPNGLRDENGVPIHRINICAKCEPQNGRFIVRAQNTTYEWDSKRDILCRRYNPVSYELVDFIPDLTHDQSILVHKTQGITLFANSTQKVTDAFPVVPRNAEIRKCDYNEEHQLLFLLCRKAHTDYVTYSDLHSGVQAILYTGGSTAETVVDISAHITESKVLVLTDRSCYEYEIRDTGIRKLHLFSAGRGEEYLAGRYTNSVAEASSGSPCANSGDIEVVLRGRQSGTPFYNEPVCMHYEKASFTGTYHPTLGYYLPHWDVQNFPFFLAVLSSKDLPLCPGSSPDSDAVQLFSALVTESSKTSTLTRKTFQPQNPQVTQDRPCHRLETIYVLFTDLPGFADKSYSPHRISYLSPDYKTCIMFNPFAGILPWSYFRDKDSPSTSRLDRMLSSLDFSSISLHNAIFAKGHSVKDFNFPGNDRSRYFYNPTVKNEPLQLVPVYDRFQYVVLHSETFEHLIAIPPEYQTIAGASYALSYPNMYSIPNGMPWRKIIPAGPDMFFALGQDNHIHIMKPSKYARIGAIIYDPGIFISQLHFDNTNHWSPDKRRPFEPLQDFLAKNTGLA